MRGRLLHTWSIAVVAFGLPAAEPALADEHKIDAFVELGPNFTTNAFFADDDPQQDGYATPNVGLQFSGPITKHLSYFGRAFVNDVRHDRFDSLNTDMAAVLAELRYTTGHWLFTARANPQWNYSQDFDEFQLALYDYSLIAVRSFEIGKVTIKPKLTFGRLDSTMAVTERTRIGPGIDVSYKINDKMGLSLRWSSIYQIFDEAVGGDDRNDWRHGLSAGFSWTIRDGLDTGLSVGFSRNESSIEGKSWSRLDVTPALNISMKLGRIPQ
jgi:hypothetical protein